MADKSCYDCDHSCSKNSNGYDIKCKLYPTPIVRRVDDWCGQYKGWKSDDS